MIHVLEMPEHGEPSAWFAYNYDDFAIKVAADDPLREHEIFDVFTARDLLESVGHTHLTSEARAAFPAITALGDAHGWDTVLYRADHLLGRGVFSDKPVVPREAQVAALRARATLDHPLQYRIYWTDADAMGAYEGADPLLNSPAHWKARHLLREQLLALELLADDA